MSEKIIVKKKKIDKKPWKNRKMIKHVLKKWSLWKKGPSWKKTLDKKKSLKRNPTSSKKTHEKITPFKNLNLFD